MVAGEKPVRARINACIMLAGSYILSHELLLLIATLTVLSQEPDTRSSWPAWSCCGLLKLHTHPLWASGRREVGLLWPASSPAVVQRLMPRSRLPDTTTLSRNTRTQSTLVATASTS